MLPDCLEEKKEYDSPLAPPPTDQWPLTVREQQRKEYYDLIMSTTKQNNRDKILVVYIKKYAF